MAIYYNGTNVTGIKYGDAVVSAVYLNNTKIWPSSGTYYIYNEGTINCTLTTRSFTWQGTTVTYPLDTQYSYDGHIYIYSCTNGATSTQDGITNIRGMFDITNIFIPAGATLHGFGYIPSGHITINAHRSDGSYYRIAHFYKTNWGGHGDINYTFTENIYHLAVLGSNGAMEYTMYYVIP